MGLRFGLQRHFLLKKNVNIISDQEFSKSNQVYGAAIVELELARFWKCRILQRSFKRRPPKNPPHSEEMRPMKMKAFARTLDDSQRQISETFSSACWNDLEAITSTENVLVNKTQNEIEESLCAHSQR